MHDHKHAERIVQIILAWAKAQPKIRAVALIGSYARGTARADAWLSKAARAEHGWSNINRRHRGCFRRYEGIAVVRPCLPAGAC